MHNGAAPRWALVTSLDEVVHVSFIRAPYFPRMSSCQDLDAIAALAFSGVSAACRRISQQPSTGVPGSAGPASSAKESRLLLGDDATEWSPPENVGIQLTGTRIAVPIAARAAARTCAEANGGPLLGLGLGARAALAAGAEGFSSLETFLAGVECLARMWGYDEGVGIPAAWWLG